MALLEPELKQIARRLFKKESPGHTLQPTALVNELYLRLVGRQSAAYEGRLHFLAAASRIMRHMLIDHARRRSARRRTAHVTLKDDVGLTGTPDLDILQLDGALRRLEREHPREAQVVELRCFGGLTLDETATLLGVATGTVKRDWRFARSYLELEMRPR